MAIHIYQHPKMLSDGTRIYRWYYYFYDQTGKKVQKACKGCQTEQEAMDFTKSITAPEFSPKKQTEIVGEIAQYMFLPESDHVKRRKQLGKSTEESTMKESRNYLNHIISAWGNSNIKSLTTRTIMSFLFESNHSNRWKNRFLETLGEVYEEAPWYGCVSPKPPVRKFSSPPHKADAFTKLEIQKIMSPENFPSRQFYLFFLLTFSAGLRIGETRAIKVRQIIFERKLIIIDGFIKRNGTRTNYNKKGNPSYPKFRIVYLPDYTLDQIRFWIAENSLSPEDYCFTFNNKPIKAELAENVFYRMLQKTGFIPEAAKIARNKRGEGRKPQSKIKQKTLDGRRLIPHSLRYTYITFMSMYVCPKDLMPMTGHTSEIMINYYNRMVLDMTIETLNPVLRTASDSLFMPETKICPHPETLQPEFCFQEA